MNKTGFLYDERYQLHKTGRYHPEVPDRLVCVYRGIQEAGLLSSWVYSLPLCGERTQRQSPHILLVA